MSRQEKSDSSQNNENNHKFLGFINCYVTDSTNECFKLCVKDFKQKELNESEQECVVQCFAKFYYSYMNMGEILRSSQNEF